MNPNGLAARSKQRASVLIMTLILLIMLTVLGLGMISMNSTQTRIATNSADAQQAYQTAEGALDSAANNLLAGNYTLASFLANTNGLYAFDPSITPRWKSVTWTSNTSVIPCTTCGMGTQAAFIIEYMPPATTPGAGTRQVYRVTARALGVSGKSPVILQSTVLTP